MWCRLIDIRDRLNVLRKKYNLCSHLPLEILRSPLSAKSEDMLFLLPTESHCYVGLFIKSTGTCFIADGANFIHHPQGFQSVKDFFKRFKLVPIRYDQQTKIDHCGSSACCIGIELSRLYKIDRTMETTMVALKKNGTHTLYSPATIRDNTKKILNQGESKSFPEETGRSKGKRVFHRCPYCNWSRQTSHRLPLVNHMRTCNKK